MGKGDTTGENPSQFYNNNKYTEENFNFYKVVNAGTGLLTALNKVTLVPESMDE